MYGGFREIPPYARPGWIVNVTSKFGRMWLLAVVVDEPRHQLEVKRIDAVPWQWWDGPSENSMYNGDRPDEYEKLRDETLS